MSRKMPYYPTKVSSPTTSDGSNSSADNNYSNNGSCSPRRKTADLGNNAGSPGRGRGMHSLAEYHQDFQSKMPQQQQQGDEPSPANASRPRIYLHSNSDSSALSRSGGYSKSGSTSASPGYYPGSEAGSLPSGSMPRQRDTPDQVASIVSDSMCCAPFFLAL